MGHSSYFPLFVDVSRKKILFFGGGNIATRRIGVLNGFAENICMISPEASETLGEMARSGQIFWKRDRYDPSFLEDADLVFACTGDKETDVRIVNDCRERNILVNAASDHGLCDFFFPAIVEKNQTVIGINGSGVDHSGVKELRIRIEEMLDGGSQQENEQDCDDRQ
ncbi:precorrin-2 dehydrogenase/sirohydrochlorin ferrochelatase family protein [Mobilibacterium timonense]|uniref:precorrin-2 dehydrogenase/sirohydrochlorin ferrochelatase family protein n=1 Tax=Mobilibacterium timonense TaxID=1871012 RepID=UPI000985A63D|nr:bifunctional precorrin-2 dehydrogenase/sirohydrochlorin ferrochelatase [Mobilibacterium timonense]